MFEEIFNIALNNGLWAGLFVALLVFVLKDGNTREKKYQATIEVLNNHLGVVNDIKEEVTKLSLQVNKKVSRGEKNEG